MNFFKKISKLLILTLVLCLALTPMSLADSNPFAVEGTSGTGLQGSIQNILLQLLGAISTAGYIIAVIMVIWVGIQYMIATPVSSGQI